VRGLLDENTRRLDIGPFLPDPTTRLAEVGDGDVVWVRVASVQARSCEVEPYPGVRIGVSGDDVTSYADDDLHDLLSIGEVVAARANRSADGALALSLSAVGEDDTPGSALAIFPDGPPWLVPAQRMPPQAETIPHPRPTTEPTPEPERPDLLERAAADPEPEPAPEPTLPRPTPMLIARQRRPDRPAPILPTPASRQPGSGREAVRTMGLQLETARATARHLEIAVAELRNQLRSAQGEIRLLQDDLHDQGRALALKEQDLRRMRARLRTEVQDERRVNGLREVPAGQDLFLDLAEQFEFDVHDRWARRILATEKADRPLRPYRLGARFLESLREVEGIDRAKVADVVVDVLTGLAENSSGRDMHPLRAGNSTGEPLRHEGYTCWRVAIQRRSPAARRLHFWRSADDIVLSRVVLHDDFEP
jgi:hypothetical protein